MLALGIVGRCSDCLFVQANRIYLGPMFEPRNDALTSRSIRDPRFEGDDSLARRRADFRSERSNVTDAEALGKENRPQGVGSRGGHWGGAIAHEIIIAPLGAACYQPDYTCNDE